MPTRLAGPARRRVLPMRQRRGQVIRSGGGYEVEEDINPNAYLTNLVDCMLVLALGLMLALVVAWNAEVPNMTQVEQTSQMYEVDDIDTLTDPESLGGSGYVDMGSVYQDPKTGKMYLIESGSSGSSSDSSDSSSGSGASGSSSTGTELTRSQTTANSLPQSGVSNG